MNASLIEFTSYFLIFWTGKHKNALAGLGPQIPFRSRPLEVVFLYAVSYLFNTTFPKPCNNMKFRPKCQWHRIASHSLSSTFLKISAVHRGEFGGNPFFGTLKTLEKSILGNCPTYINTKGVHPTLDQCARTPLDLIKDCHQTQLFRKTTERGVCNCPEFLHRRSDD